MFNRRLVNIITGCLVLVVIIAWTDMLLAQARGPGPAQPDRGTARTKTGKTGNETYSVIQVSEDVKVISSMDKATMQKKYDDDYKQDLKKYNEAKKDKKNTDAATLKKPDKLKDYTVKMLKGGFKTQEDAQKYADDKIQERDKGSKKPADAGKWN
jgi:hypothetical protein